MNEQLEAEGQMEEQPQVMVTEENFGEVADGLMAKMQDLFLNQNLGVVVAAMDTLYEIMISNVEQIEGKAPAMRLVVVRMARTNQLAERLGITQEFIDDFYATGIQNIPEEEIKVKNQEETSNVE